MTLPEQSDRAVAQTREFLVRLASPYVENGIKGIRREVRAEALALLRHYPYSYRESDEKRGNGDISGAWIPVSERLPEEDVDVLAMTKYGMHVASLDEDGLWNASHGDSWEFPNPSHWMPLPEPPEVK